jgi:hypothetical protein
VIIRSENNFRNFTNEDPHGVGQIKKTKFYNRSRSNVEDPHSSGLMSGQKILGLSNAW